MAWANIEVIVAILLIAIVVWIWSRLMQRRTGLPSGKVIYTDAGAWYSNEEVLYAEATGLVGKPDYLIEQANGAIIPVELKSGRAPNEPHEGHVLQLAAYCLLVEASYGIRPDHGILQYRDQAFAIDYSEELEADLLDLLDEMGENVYAPELERNHNNWRRCARCGFNQQCDQRLG